MKIKICGLSRRCDIDFVNEAEPDYCGFIINVPKSRRNVTPKQAAALRERLSARIVPVGVFVNAQAETAAALAEEGVIGMIQLHGGEDEEYVNRLRELTRAPIIQAFSIRGPEDVRRAARSGADFVLFDHGAGGTGERFDWSLVREIGRPYLLAGRPYFLAGGLEPGNIGEAALACADSGLYGVDVSSGVETDGFKDREKILAAVAAVRRCRI